MDNCLDENEIAQYAEYLNENNVEPDKEKHTASHGKRRSVSVS